MKAAPLTTNWGVIGTAFDYLARFEIQRRNPAASAREGWVADAAIERFMRMRLRVEGTYLDLLPGGECHDALNACSIPEDRAFGRYGAQQLNQAKERHREFAAGRSSVRDIASSCIDLALLDNFYRGGFLPKQVPWTNHDDDVKDLLNLHRILPADFGAGEHVDLNPTFGNWSHYVGGADADLVIGDVLVDIKTTKNLELSDKFWHQLIGYAILDELNSKEMEDPPNINRVSIYFSRHGAAWIYDIKPLRELPSWQKALDFFETELAPPEAPRRPAKATSKRAKPKAKRRS